VWHAAASAGAGRETSATASGCAGRPAVILYVDVLRLRLFRPELGIPHHLGGLQVVAVVGRVLPLHGVSLYAALDLLGIGGQIICSVSGSVSDHAKEIERRIPGEMIPVPGKKDRDERPRFQPSPRSWRV